MCKEKNCNGWICMKCLISLVVVVVWLNDLFCKFCFFVYFMYKFCVIIGKFCVIKVGEKVLLVFFGGLFFSVMLYLVCEGLSDIVVKKFWFEFGIVFIDEGEVLK